MENTEQRKYQRKSPPNRKGIFWGAYISPELSQRVHTEMYINKWTKTEAMEKLMDAGLKARAEASADRTRKEG